jgi:hypothetical protein
VSVKSFRENVPQKDSSPSQQAIYTSLGIGPGESFGIDPKASLCIDDNFYVIRKDQGREITFLRIWGKVAEQFDLLGICPTDGWSMGIAAAVIGWNASEGDPEIRAFNIGKTHFLLGRERWKPKPYWRRGVQRIVKQRVCSAAPPNFCL